MSASSESTAKTGPFAAALALQEEHARSYTELAERIRSKSPEGASVLLTMRQRQEAQLRQLMCIYGFSARKDSAIARPSRARVTEGAKATTEGLLGASSRDPELERKMFVLQVVQPGLAGLMDGSVSTLAPLFAAAFATHQNWQTFLVGLAASIGAGISMGFAEALSDDGSLTGRGSPWLRGAASGVMTALGGLGHSMPYLVPDRWANAFWIATAIAGVVVFFELWAIAYIRARYMDTPFLHAVFQIVLGGVIVLGVGILIGAA